tara:strand:+ start:483 stop:1004 length:522 start_codon:yes stop_codon:yes gene_type:complete
MSEIDDIRQAKDCFIEMINYSVKPCVYFLLQDDEIVYIGKADNGCGSRLSDHAKPNNVNSKWDLEDISKRVSLKVSEDKIFNGVRFKEYHYATNLENKEMEYIQKYIPKYNFCGVAMKERKRRMYEKNLIENFLKYNNKLFNLTYIKKDNQWKIVKNEVDFLIEDCEEKHGQF